MPFRVPSKKGMEDAPRLSFAWRNHLAPDTGDKDPNTHQAHAGYIGSTDNK